MKKLFFLGACLVAVAFRPVLAQTTGPEVVVVQFYHQATPRLYAAIARGVAKPEVLDMKGDAAEEAQFCQQIIAKLYRDGYTIKSTFGGSSINTGTLVFIKEK
ncbi:MAG: hypothetical protein EOO63_00980 [Hymenobacter sp.]|nr:MAG: hypothetical protein EOO63_00980 [Hymenobacter sp.]